MGLNGSTDFLVIGAGVIGLNVARELRRTFTDASVTVIDKEAQTGEHASGRNSGILHAGFYYTADSLKARFTRDGNAALTEYCLERGLRINQCGKLVVAQSDSDLAGLANLEERARNNGVTVQRLTVAEAQEIEPRVKTVEAALFSPTTSSVDPIQVLRSIEGDAMAAGCSLRYGVRYLGKGNQGVLTSAGMIRAGYVVNAAGLYADKVAQDYGFGKEYEVLPFKGVYLYQNAGSTPLLRTHIYPVPDLKNPFLGVHFTLTVDCRVKIGPTAIPALWREQYGGFARFSGHEFARTIMRQIQLFTHAGFDFRRLALEELRKYYRPHLVSQAARLARDVRADDFRLWGKSGIRAQLMRKKDKTLEMDFVLQGDTRSFHVLNAVSPAFTCSIPFSRYVVEKIAQHLQQE